MLRTNRITAHRPPRSHPKDRFHAGGFGRGAAGAVRAARAVLAGDFAHPVGAGQGASMAIEDAIVLARALRDGAVPDALAVYERERRARVARMVKSAGANRDAKTAGPLARRARNLVMPPAMRLFYERGTAWLYTHDVTAGWEPAGHAAPGGGPGAGGPDQGAALPAGG
ncbi:hypothetical protein GWI34_30955 [Actinomadura sp. DSM 109109]|nr:hypothetical protein [Actinomadura lepetitiana]